MNHELRITNYKLKSKFFVLLKAWTVVVCLCLFISSALAQVEEPPKPAAPRAVQIPTPVEKVLPNGLRVIVIERKNVPLITAQILIKSGGEVDPQNLAGAADMTAELLTKGTKTRSASEIAEQIEFLGGSIESGAAWDASSVTFRVTSDKFDKAMQIAADTIKNPAFEQTEIDRYKTQLLDELTVNLTQPGAVANYVANRVVFNNSAYAHPLSGTPESLKNIGRADLLKIHQNYYKPDNAILIVAGDVSAPATFALAQKHLGDWAKDAPKKETQALAADNSFNSKASDKISVDKITVVDLPSAGQAAVSIAKSGINRSDNAYFQGIVTNSLLNGYSARLNQEIRIKRGLSYGAGSNFSARRLGGIFSTRAQTKNESAAEVAEIMVNELNRLATEPIGESELTPRKAVLTGGFSREFETTGGLVNQIAQLALYDLPLSQINSYIQNVQAVDNNSIQRFVKKFYGGSKAQIVIAGDAKKFLPDLQKRFPSVEIQTISIAELDLNNAALRKTKSARARN